ncbi:hypothetical protein ACROYT_G005870 [Oculina patagonica]
MSQEDNDVGSSEARTENDSQKFRSPCLDAHHEAFILRSSWTVGNLYAANLHLGQSYVKQVKDLEKQRRVWLSRKEKEQETMLRRWEALEKRAKNSYHSDSLSELKDSDVGKSSLGPGARKFRQRATTVGTCSQVASLEKLGTFGGREHFKNHRSRSQPTGSGLFVTGLTKEESVRDHLRFQKREKLPRTQSVPNASSMDCAFALSSRSGRSVRRTVSGLPSGIKSSRYFATEPEEKLTANSHLIPRWLPSNLRTQNIRQKSLI